MLAKLYVNYFPLHENFYIETIGYSQIWLSSFKDVFWS